MHTFACRLTFQTKLQRRLNPDRLAQPHPSFLPSLSISNSNPIPLSRSPARGPEAIRPCTEAPYNSADKGCACNSGSASSGLACGPKPGAQANGKATTVLTAGGPKVPTVFFRITGAPPCCPRLLQNPHIPWRCLRLLYRIGGH
jgi:hypothetical protein